MDQQRGRSPSVGQQQPHINHAHSPSPQQYQDNSNTAGLGLGLDTSLDHQYSNSSYPQSQGLPAYNDVFLTSQQGQQYTQGGVVDPIFAQSQSFNQQSDFNQQFKQEDLSPHNQPSLSPYNQQQQPSFSQQLLGDSNFGQGDFPLYSATGGQADQFDPGFFMNEPQQPTEQSINPALIGDMSSPPPPHTPTPPHMLQPEPQQSPSHHSPAFNQHQFQRSPGHSRNASLGPESAAFPQGQMPSEWSMMPPQFTTHRRSPSEYSDVSVSSAAPSPNLPHHDAFESIEQHHSPLVRPQDPSAYSEVLSIGNFSLSDPQIQHAGSPRHGFSPAHSPAISPRLGPQQMPMINNQNNFMISPGMQNTGYVPSNGPGVYGDQSQDSFAHQNRSGSAEMGQAQQMVAPEINVEFAPPSRQSSFEPPRPMTLDQDALTPPERGKLTPVAS